jgi:hypothetical protein
MLTISCSRADGARTINDVLDGYGPAFRSWLEADDTRIVLLTPKQQYGEVSPALRQTTIDAWPVPPAGLFVVSEATVYLRVLSRMTIAHELVHAYDRARGNGVYFSGSNATVRRLFAAARGFVTPYAASGIDEYFAESGRALHPGGNDPRCPWPPATPDRLKTLDPAMYEYLTALFAEPPAAVIAA